MNLKMKDCKIGDICEIKVGGDKPKTFSKNKTLKCSVPVYSNGEENEGLFGFTDIAKINCECITLSSRGNVGTVFYRTEPFTPIVRLISIIPDESKIDKKYLYYYLKNCKIGGYGTSQQQITSPWLKKTKIHIIDDLSYQKKIGEVLYNIDLLIKNNTARIENLNNEIENIYSEWFLRFRYPKSFNDIKSPESWKREKLKNCVKRLPFGKTYKKEELDNYGNVIVIDQSKNEFLGYYDGVPEHIASLNAPILLFGDHTCKSKLMIKEFSLGENIIPFISKDSNSIDNYYLYYATNKLINTEEYKRHWSRFSEFKILIPDYSLQLKFSEIAKSINEAVDLLENVNIELIKIRELLLPRLISGIIEI